jgi:hypothetical protein
VDALLEAVRAAYEGGSDAAWRALDDAKRPFVYGDTAVEATMLGLLDDPRWEARAAAAEVLRYLVGAEAPGDGRVPVPRALARACALVAAMDGETDARVRTAIVTAFVDLSADVGDALTAAFVCRFAADAAAEVRLAVAGVLGAGNEDEHALEALIVLAADADARVREWACFALGQQTRRDDDAIPSALRARLDDESEAVRDEAEAALALHDRPRPTCGVPRHVGCACMRAIFR